MQTRLGYYIIRFVEDTYSYIYILYSQSVTIIDSEPRARVRVYSLFAISRFSLSDEIQMRTISIN